MSTDHPPRGSSPGSHQDPSPEQGIRNIAVVLLRNRAGEILMQHRTDDAPIDPSLWSVPGGAVQPPETPLDGAHRELFEEAGLRATLVPHRVLDGSRWERPLRTYHVFTGTTNARDEDIVLGEGQAMRFLSCNESAAWT